MSRAKLFGVLQLVVHQIHGNNHPRASQGAALDHMSPTSPQLITTALLPGSTFAG
jgi:hypothetical protein